MKLKNSMEKGKKVVVVRKLVKGLWRPSSYGSPLTMTMYSTTAVP